LNVTLKGQPRPRSGVGSSLDGWDREMGLHSDPLGQGAVLEPTLGEGFSSLSSERKAVNRLASVRQADCTKVMQ
jgi:hypothetical protein